MRTILGPVPIAELHSKGFPRVRTSFGEYTVFIYYFIIFVCIEAIENQAKSPTRS